MRFPLQVSIETVNFCNARCPFCPLFVGERQIDRDLRPPHTMTMALFTAVVDQIAAWDELPEFISLNMDGEPLMDAHLPARLAALKARALAGRTFIQTNGHLMSAALARAIAEGGIGTVYFALDGATRETYEASRVRCDFDRVLANLRELVRVRDELGSPTRIAIKFVRTTQNAHEVRAAYDLLSEFLGPNDTMHDAISVDWADEALAASGLVYTTMRGVENMRRKPGGCAMANTRLIVHCDGRVPACCWDYNFFVLEGAPLGDASHTDLLAIWRGDAFAGLRGKLISGTSADLPKKCRSCVAIHEFEQDVPPPAIEGAGYNPGYGYVYSFPAAS